MEVCCGGKNCSKREQCRVYESNYWKYHDNSQWAQYEDWCGDFSKDYKLFKELTNKSTLLRREYETIYKTM